MLIYRHQFIYYINVLCEIGVEAHSTPSHGRRRTAIVERVIFISYESISEKNNLEFIHEYFVHWKP